MKDLTSQDFTSQDFTQRPTSNPYDAPQSAGITQGTKERSWLAVLFSFEGRAGQSTYWAVKLGGLVALSFVMVLMAGVGSLLGKVNQGTVGLMILGPVLPLLIAYFWAAIAVTVKRFHDRNKSGVMVFVGLIPYIGGLWIFIECGLLEGTAGPNQYGASPETL